MPLSKKLRFEVFKRDSFTCQYCGRSAPEIILHADHIEPRKHGGDDTILNLLTSCLDCNLGKGARRLEDSTVIQKQKTTLDALQDRREQIEMMLEWQRGLEGLEDETAEQIGELWHDLTIHYYLTAQGLRDLKKFVRRFPAEEVVEAMRTAVSFYLEFEQGEATQESVDRAFRSIPGICANRQREATDPRLKTVHHVKGIARKRLTYIHERDLEQILLTAIDVGVENPNLFRAAGTARSWTNLKNILTDLIDQAEEEEAECHSDPG